MTDDAERGRWLNHGDRQLCSGQHVFASVTKGSCDVLGPSHGISYSWYVARPGMTEVLATGEVRFTTYDVRKSDLALAKRLAKAALKVFDERDEDLT